MEFVGYFELQKGEFAERLGTGDERKSFQGCHQSFSLSYWNDGVTIS